MALPTNVTPNTPGHATLHNEANAEINLLSRDTGWRDVSSLLTNGFTVSTLLRIRRKDDRVQLLIRGLSGVSATNTVFMACPKGFEPVTDIEDGPFRSSLDAYTEKLFVAGATGFRMNATGKALAGTAAQIFEYPCTASWPSVLPGTPA